MGMLIRSTGASYAQALVLAASQLAVESLHTVSKKHRYNALHSCTDSTFNNKMNTITSQNNAVDESSSDNIMENIDREKSLSLFKGIYEKETAYSDIIEFLTERCQVSKIEVAREEYHNIHRKLLSVSERKIIDSDLKNLFRKFEYCLTDSEVDVDSDGYSTDDVRNRGSGSSSATVTASNSGSSSSTSISNNTDTNNDVHVLNETVSTARTLTKNSTTSNPQSIDTPITIEEILSAFNDLLSAISFFEIKTIHDMQPLLKGAAIASFLGNIPQGGKFGEVKNKSCFFF